MKNSILVLTLIWSIVWLTSSASRRTKSQCTQTFHRTGEAVAVDELIHKYEEEHREFYKQQIGNDEYLEWPDLKKKNLANYCRKYLKRSVPNRKTDNATGIKIRRTLNYGGKNTTVTSKIVIVQCNVVYNSYHLLLYLARAPEPNCVYALKCTRKRQIFYFTLIDKYCDFESTPHNKPKKQNGMVSKKHHLTGQPIAKEKYLLEYELEHQELLNREGDGGACIEWPYAIMHPNLDFYCYQYMKECVPNRRREGVKGGWRTEIFQYQQLHAKYSLFVTTVACLSASHGSPRRYYMTRSNEANCVYALLRRGTSIYYPLLIVFKHCNFDPLINPKETTQNYNAITKDIIPKPEMKEEMLDTLKIQQFFPAE